MIGLAAWAGGDLDGAYRSYADGMASLQKAGNIADVVNGANTLATIRIAQGRLRDAMRMGKLAPNDIDYFCAHGIGNKEYDIGDTLGIKKALGQHAYHIPVTSIKPVPGQCFGAGAAMQLAAACMILQTEIMNSV